MSFSLNVLRFYILKIVRYKLGFIQVLARDPVYDINNIHCKKKIRNATENYC